MGIEETCRHKYRQPQSTTKNYYYYDRKLTKLKNGKV